MGLGLSHCAPAMCLVGDGTTDLSAAYKAGVRIGLGCDGAASNDNSNLLECVRLAYLLQSLANKDQHDPLPPPTEFMKFATAGGASLLNRPELGSLAIGQAADFFAMDLSDIDFVGAAHDPALLPIKTGFGKPVDLTVINGKVVWQNGEFTQFDEFEAAYSANTVFNQVIHQSPTMQSLRKSSLK
jgi:hydroxyatrazine ethylaminohydrolase